MDKKISIDVNGISITLTDEQIAQIDRQRKTSKMTYKDILSYEVACEILGVQSNISQFSGIARSSDYKMHTSLHKLKTIVKAINHLSGFKADWNNSDQSKFYPWFNMSGDVSFDGVYSSWPSHCSVLGSRLCVGSKDEARWLGETYIELYKDMLAE